MPLIHIATEKPYDVHIERGAMQRAGELISGVHRPCRTVLVTDSTVAPLYADTVQKSLENAGFQVFTHIIPAGEEHKNLKTFGEILSFMAQSGLSRSDLAVALGGGVAGDMTGFSAACYERGIDFVQIPTTLLAMVDASVGGKTAVDLPEGKNLAGAFHQPILVVCDTACLDSLPKERISDGAAEMLKHGLIADAELFKNLTPENILSDAENLVARNVEIKASFVAGDEREAGKRQMLNFGHTIGHAVEKLSGYTLSHGQAVAIGIVAAVRGGNIAGVGKIDLGEITSALEKFGLPTRCPFSAQEVYDIALSDKKRLSDGISFVFLKEIGHAETVKINLDDFRHFLDIALRGK